MKTKEEILKETGINWQRLNKELPLLASKILIAMEMYNTEELKNLDLHIVSNAKRTVCDDCKYKGTSKWLDPCHTCIEGDLKEQTDC